MDISRHITVEEAARRLHVSTDTIRSWIKQGRLRALRVGRRLLLDPDAVAALVTEVKS